MDGDIVRILVNPATNRHDRQLDLICGLWYNSGMTARLSDDLQREVDAHAGQPIKVEHPLTHEVYVIVDNDTHERAMKALREQEDLASIARGIEQMEAGEGRPLAKADSGMRKELGFPPRQ